VKKTLIIINIPNLLTVIRILLIPVFVIFVLRNQLNHALIVFIIAGISDGLDGLIARYFNQRTVLGEYLDPIADKLLVSSAFISMAILKSIPNWLAVIVISRDFLIVIGVSLCALENIKIEMKPSLVSKYNTVFQLLTITLSLLHYSYANLIKIEYINPIYWITAGFTVISGLHYTYKGLKILHEYPTIEDP
jgi:cardiolipin synthase (CMP-forming)